MRKLLLIAVALVLMPPISRGKGKANGNGEWFTYIGTYTRQNSKGIYAYRFRPASGEITEIGLAAETESPSFLAVHPNQRFLYAANEVSNYEGQKAGSISSFAIDAATGKLKLLNRVSSKGDGPCHVALDRTGKWLIAANYGGGSVALFPVHADGSLGEASSFVQHTGSSANPQRQSEPHAHFASVTPDNRFVLVADLGLDEFLIYRLDRQKGALTPNDPPFAKVAAGSGPRHGAFRPDGKFFYGLNEIVPSVVAFRYNAPKGSLQELQTISTLPADYTGNNSGAEIAAHPSGKFLYSSNRGHNTIATFQIDAAKGTLTAGERVPTKGRTPRNFAIDPTGAWLFAANQDTNNIALFRIDQKTGALTDSGKVLQVSVPVCVVFSAGK
jgi:6-phosphogluconolactonase